MIPSTCRRSRRRKACASRRLAQGDEFDQPVVSCHHIRVTVEEEPEEEVEESAEVPTVSDEEADKDDSKPED